MRNLNLISIVSLFLFNACANVKPPTGGPKDLDPPVMLRTIPDHRSTNFHSDRITLFFDEQVESKSLISELIITPDDNLQYKELPKKKSITIKFKDTLRSNTTYNFNFGNAIVDITEKNPCENATFALSTGPDIDTAFIKGNIIDIYTQTIPEDVIVMLHFLSDTVDVQTQKPSYLSRVDAKGNFIIENLPQDTFLLYAIQDLNGNLQYNPGQEKIARFPHPVVPSFDSSEYSLQLSSQNTKPFVLLNSKHEWNFSSLSFNKGLYDYSIAPDSLYSYSLSQSRTIHIFHPFTITDSIPIQLKGIDSIGYEIDTALYLKNKEEGDTLDPDFLISYQPADKKVKRIPDSVILEFNIPLSHVQLDSFLIIKDIKDTAIIDNIEHNLLNANTLSIKFNTKVKQTIALSGLNDQYISKYSDTISNISVKYEIVSEENYGRIEGDVKSNGQNVILELITPDFKIVESQLVNGPYTFEYVDPGSYKLRAIIDSNVNGKWDPGNHYENIQPEEVIIYDEKILLKANWIVEDKDFDL